MSKQTTDSTNYQLCSDPNCTDCGGKGKVWCPEENVWMCCVVEVKELPSCRGMTFRGKEIVPTKESSASAMHIDRTGHDPFQGLLR